MVKKFLKKDIGRIVAITYDLEKFPKTKQIPGKRRIIGHIEFAIAMGAEMVDQGEILSINKEYVHIRKNHPMQIKLYEMGRKQSLLKDVPYKLMKEWKYLD